MKNKLTKKELAIVNFALRSMISWGEGGCFTKDNGSGEVDKAKMKVAEKALEKLEIIEILTK